MSARRRPRLSPSVEIGIATRNWTILLACLVVLHAGCNSAESVQSDLGIRDGSPIDTLAPLAIPLSGCSPYYAAAVTLGGSQSFQLAVDTGSTTTAVAAVGCADCAVSPLYDSEKAVDEGKPASASYGDGSLEWKGEIYRDTLVVGDRAPVEMDLVAIGSQQGFFDSSCDTAAGLVALNYQGILGIGTDDNVTPFTSSYLAGLVDEGASPNRFALRLCHTGGTLWLGGYDPPQTASPLQFASMMQHFGYYVAVDSISVSGASGEVVAQLNSAPALLDSGGPMLFVPPAAFATLTSTIAAIPSFQQKIGDATWLASGSSVVALAISPEQLDLLLPPLIVQVGASPPFALSLPATESYLIWAHDGKGGYYYFPGIASNASLGGLVDLGNAVMRSYLTVFDRENGRVGFAQAKPCP